jgi:RHS repeat-associated protein
LAHGYTGTYGEEELWLGTVSATGNSTITVSFSSSVSGSMIALTSQEFTNGTGPSTTWANDVGGGNNGYSSTVTFPTLKPTRSSGELYVGVANAAYTPSAGSTSGFTYDIVPYQVFIFNPSITTTSTPTATQSATGNFESTAALIRAGVPSTSTTHYAWNPYGELCNASAAVITFCGATPPTGTSYTYNGDGLRMTAATAVTVGPTTTTTTTDSTWDYVSSGSIPLNINDAATSGSTTTNTSYIYGDLLFGGTAPIEQVVTTGSGTTAVFLVASPQGVQGAYSSTGALQELATYSLYGVQTISSGSRVTPFGFQGSYTDSTGFTYLINRYYDPTTDQFLSIDADVGATDQPYVFTNDNPINEEDPLGLVAVALMGSSPDYVPTLQTTQWKSGNPTYSYTQSIDAVGPGGASISIDVTVAVAGPNAVSNVDVDPINGNVSVSAGLSTGNFSASASSNFATDATVDQFSFSYSQSQTIGSGTNRDHVTVTLDETISYPEYSAQGPDINVGLSKTGVLVVIGAGIIAVGAAAWQLLTNLGKATL